MGHGRRDRILGWPVTGGLLTLASWRLIFFINVPAGAAALVLLARTAPSPRRPAPFDWAGQVTAVLAMGGLTYGAIEAGTAGRLRRGCWPRSRSPWPGWPPSWPSRPAVLIR